MKIYSGVCELVGRTPLLRLERIEQRLGLGARLVAKLESFNPGGSAKDRVALYAIDAAEKRGELSAGAMIIEPTSGNTGIGIAMVAAAKGYKARIFMPSNMSAERIKLMHALGAEVILTPASLGMSGAIAAAEENLAVTPGAFMLKQFTNPDNPAAHEAATGPEIYQDTDGEVDIFVAAAGTGGTVSGVGRYLKRVKPEVRVYAAEPAASAVINGAKPGAHKIQGIGAGFIPEILDTGILDGTLTVRDEDAFAYSELLARTEGILAGISSGAALYAACELAKREENRGKTIVVLLPDTGERYLSSELYEQGCSESAGE